MPAAVWTGMAVSEASTATMEIRTAPARAQFIKVTVDPADPASGLFACIDEATATHADTVISVEDVEPVTPLSQPGVSADAVA